MQFWPAFFFFPVAAWVIFLVAACRIFCCGMWNLSCRKWGLVPWPGIEPGPVALGTWSLSHWTTREVLKRSYPGQSIGEECVQSREHRAAVWWTCRNSVLLGVYNEGLGHQQRWLGVWKQWLDNPASCKKICWTFSKNSGKTLKGLKRKISRLNVNFSDIIQFQEQPKGSQSWTQLSMHTHTLLRVDQRRPVRGLMPHDSWQTARKVKFSLGLVNMNWFWAF